MAEVRSPQIIVSINILYFTNTCEWWVSTMSLECDNSLITVHSANTVQAKDWWRKEDVQGNSETMLVSTRAASVHENQNIAKFFQASYSERVLQWLYLYL